MSDQTQDEQVSAESPKRFEPTCSVIICTRNRPVELERCLEALTHLDYPRFEVLVVDNAPSDNRAREVAMRWEARYVVEPVRGLSRARNRGARACDSVVLAFLDDDSVPDSEWLAGLAREFQDPQVMAVAGPINQLNSESGAEHLCAPPAMRNSEWDKRRVVDKQTPNWLEMANFGGIGDGGNMAFRRQAFDFWPGFDERLGRGALIDGSEEHYAFFSLIERGYRAMYTPHAIVRHPFPKDLQELKERRYQELSSAIGYITLLLVEQPRHRRALIKYVLEAFRGTPRTWRYSADESSSLMVSSWRKLLACLSGPVLYARSRFVRRPQTVSSSPAQLPADSPVTREPIIK